MFETKHVNVRIPVEVHAVVKKIAESEYISLNSLIVRMLSELAAERGGPKP